MGRTNWSAVVQHAAQIVRRYDTPVTLRQLFYQLVSDGTLPNSDTSYKGLSRYTAEARRRGIFPDLVDRNRTIERAAFDLSAGEALIETARYFRLDRTEGQTYNVILGVEKDGLVAQLSTWFLDRGLAITALKGYSGQAHVDKIRAMVRRDGRPAVLLYAGDFDATGEDIDRDFVERTDCWHRVLRVALTMEQIEQHDLPPMPGKASDSRSRAFIERHGKLIQVELDALDPRDLRQLFEDALVPFWDTSAYAEVLAREADQRAALEDFAARWSA